MGMTQGNGKQRRVVSNDEFVRAWKGTDEVSRKEAADNRNVLKKVVGGYRGLSKDERYACAITALWNCLEGHIPGRGNKFTTSLWRFAHWECRNELRRKRAHTESRLTLSELPLIQRHVSDESIEGPDPIREEENGQLQLLMESIEALPESWHRTVLHQYYFEDLTHEEIGYRNGGYSKEKARLRVEEALQQLRFQCGYAV